MPNSAVGNRFAAGQSGFSLPETLVAALLFAVSLMGLLHYHQILQQSFQQQSQQRQAWRFASQLLEAHEAGVVYHPVATSGSAVGDRDNAGPSLGQGWQLTLSEQAQAGECRQVTARVMTPRRYQATLDRWFCRSPSVE